MTSGEELNMICNLTPKWKLLLITGFLTFFASFGAAADNKGLGNDHLTSNCDAKESKVSFDQNTSVLNDKNNLKKWIGDPAKNTAYIVHIAEVRKNESSWSVTSSTWTAYDYDGKSLQALRIDENENPVIYNRRKTWLLGISKFSDVIGPKTFQIRYATSTTPTKKQNMANLAALLQALEGTLKTTKAPIETDTLVASCALKQDSTLPLNINIAYTLSPIAPPAPNRGKGDKDQAGALSWGFWVGGGLRGFPGPVEASAAPADKSKSKPDNTATPKASTDGSGDTQSASSDPAPVDCTAVTSDSPCKISRKITVNDREFWDIGLGMAVPGVRERTYDASKLGATPGITTHTDVYAFLDIYPWAARHDNLSRFPHLSLGIPAAGQPFHRPFFGLALPVTSWLPRRSRPFKVDIVIGGVYMQQHFVAADPTAPNGLELKVGRTLKPMFGVELPLGQLIGRVSKIGK